MNFMTGFYDEAVAGSSSSSMSSFHHRPQQLPPSAGGDEGPEDTRGGEAVQREHMFDKVVTSSDVGKPNRLVILKQHAERYFSLDSSANEKGLLLNFEDRNGKPWRFRYSYWNNSHFFVMKKSSESVPFSAQPLGPHPGHPLPANQLKKKSKKKKKNCSAWFRTGVVNLKVL